MAAKLSVSALIGERLKHIHAIPAFVILSFSRPVQRPTKLFSAFYSTLKTPISPSPSFETTPIASFLLNECGFSEHDANTICRKRPKLLAHTSYDNSRQTLLFLRDKGVNEIGVRKLFSVCPELLRCRFQDTVKPKVEFLEKIGLTGQKLLKTLDKYPHILIRSGACRSLETRVCFLQSVLDPDLAAVVSNPESDQIARKIVSNYSLTLSVIFQHPRILTQPVEKGLVRIVKDVEEMGIEKGSKAFARAFLRLSMLNRDTAKLKLESLRELGFTEEEVRILVKKAPMLLGKSEDTVKRKLENLRELGFTEEEVRILVKKFPTLLGNSEDTVKRKLENLRELGFTEEEVRILVRKFPTLLGLSVDTLRQKLKFLVEEWKLPRNAILSNPVVLCYSIEKRLKPRLNALSTLMMMNKSSKKTTNYFSTKYMSMSDGVFNSKVGLPVATQENEDGNSL